MLFTQFEDGGRGVSVDGFHDAVLGDCQLRTFADGTRRCLPLSTGRALFDDAACTELIGAWRSQTCTSTDGPCVAAGPPPGTFTRYDPGTGAPIEVRETTGPIAGALRFPLYELREGACVNATFGPPYDRLQALGGPVDLVELARDVKPTTGRFALEQLTTPDGLCVPVTLFDTQHDFSCDLIPTPDGSEAVCAPAAATDLYVSSLFSDALCSRQVAAAPGYLHAIDPATGCETYSEGVATTSPTFRLEPTSGACVASSDPGYLPGVPLELGRVERHVEATPHRLAKVRFGSGGDAVETATLFDTVLDTDCSLHTFVDGAMKDDGATKGECLPLTRTKLLALLDGTCDHLVDVAVAPSSTCDLADPTFARYDGTSPFEPVRALGMVTAAAVSGPDAMSCTPFAPPGARVLAASAMAPALAQGPATAH